VAANTLGGGTVGVFNRRSVESYSVSRVAPVSVRAVTRSIFGRRISSAPHRNASTPASLANTFSNLGSTYRQMGPCTGAKGQVYCAAAGREAARLATTARIIARVIR
jgi:hypothetical protein